MADMGKFTRVASLSALDTLIVDTEEKLELRRGLGDEKVETYEYEARHLQTPVVVVSSEVMDDPEPPDHLSNTASKRSGLDNHSTGTSKWADCKGIQS
eukprot:5603455-Amphidinium_carterae.2